MLRLFFKYAQSPVGSLALSRTNRDMGTLEVSPATGGPHFFLFGGSKHHLFCLFAVPFAPSRSSHLKFIRRGPLTTPRKICRKHKGGLRPPKLGLRLGNDSP